MATTWPSGSPSAWWSRPSPSPPRCSGPGPRPLRPPSRPANWPRRAVRTGTSRTRHPGGGAGRARPGPAGDNREVGSGDSGQVRESVRGAPAPALRPFVAWYSGYRESGLPPGQHRGLPSPYLTLIITLDDQLQLAVHPDPRRPPSRYTTLLGGLHTSPAIISHQGRQSGIQLSLKPLGARVLLGLPAGELAGLDTHADRVLGPVAIELHERVRTAPTWPRRFAVLDEVLLRELRDNQPASPEVSQAW